MHGGIQGNELPVVHLALLVAGDAEHVVHLEVAWAGAFHHHVVLVDTGRHVDAVRHALKQVDRGCAVQQEILSIHHRFEVWGCLA